MSKIEDAWEEALALWGVYTELSPPDLIKPEEWKGGVEPVAYIDLIKRQVNVNLPFLDKIKAGDALPAVLAHEIGHHIRFPHTLGLLAALQVLENRLIPGLSHSLTNLFFDLQVNEVVGRTKKKELVKVYRGSNEEIGPPQNALFAFYLAIYEELWRLPTGTLITNTKPLDTRYGWRAEARIFTNTFYDISSQYLQFIYFCTRMRRYIDRDMKQFQMALAGDIPQPDEDDLDAALRGNGAIEDALEEARERGWIGQWEAGDTTPLDVIKRVCEHRPGTDSGKLQQALVERYYRRVIEPYIFKVPGKQYKEEPLVPTVVEEWEPGDGISAIDWNTTILTHGELAPAIPLKRDKEPEPPPEGQGTLPAMEIYLDTSGSMPNPANQHNAMTLAAQILSASTIRAGGAVRGVIYSANTTPIQSGWMRDEGEARRFFLGYIGGGTDYPFPVLKKSCEERRDAIRIVISDSDFFYNLSGKEKALVDGVEKSHLLVAFLAVHREWCESYLECVMNMDKFRLVTVDSLDDYAGAASRLAEAILSR